MRKFDTLNLLIDFGLSVIDLWNKWISTEHVFLILAPLFYIRR